MELRPGELPVNKTFYAVYDRDSEAVAVFFKRDEAISIARSLGYFLFEGTFTPTAQVPY